MKPKFIWWYLDSFYRANPNRSSARGVASIASPASQKWRIRTEKLCCCNHGFRFGLTCLCDQSFMNVESRSCASCCELRTISIYILNFMSNDRCGNFHLHKISLCWAWSFTIPFEVVTTHASTLSGLITVDGPGPWNRMSSHLPSPMYVSQLVNGMKTRLDGNCVEESLSRPQQRFNFSSLCISQLANPAESDAIVRILLFHTG